MKQWNHQRRDILLIIRKTKMQGILQKLKLQKKGAKQNRTVDSAKNLDL